MVRLISNFLKSINNYDTLLLFKGKTEAYIPKASMTHKFTN